MNFCAYRHPVLYHPKWHKRTSCTICDGAEKESSAKSGRVRDFQAGSGTA